MEKCKKCEDSCTCDPNLNELGGEYNMSKKKRKEKEQGYSIRENRDSSEQKNQYYRILCHTWESLRSTGKLMKHSLGSTMTLDAGWTRW